jgi:protein TonB
MRRVFEFAVFVGLAIGAHLAMGAMRPTDQGSSAMGEEGEALVSLQAASSSIAEMVEVWERPPEIAEAATLPPPAPVLPESELPQMQPEAPQVMPEPPSMPGLAIPQADSLPDRSVTAPPPPPVLKPETQPNPELAEHRPRLRPAPAERQPTPERATATQTTAASPAQKAQGQGGGSNAGQRAEQKAATRDANRQRSLVAEWGATLRARIERRKRYPSATRGVSGTVTVRINVGRDGALRGVAVARSSGHAALDQAALQAVKAASRFPAAPNGLQQPDYTFTLNMNFSS